MKKLLYLKDKLQCSDWQHSQSTPDIETVHKGWAKTNSFHFFLFIWRVSIFKHFSLSRTLLMSGKLPTSWKQEKSWSELSWNWSLLWDLFCLTHVLFSVYIEIMNILNTFVNDSSACWALSLTFVNTCKVNRTSRDERQNWTFTDTCTYLDLI